LIDDVLIYKRVLSDEDVKRLMYTVVDSKQEIGIIGQWTFNDGGEKGIVKDTSGLGNHGTIQGGVTFTQTHTKPVHLRKFDVKIEIQN
jgi:hypothetical protein